MTIPHRARCREASESGATVFTKSGAQTATRGTANRLTASLLIHVFTDPRIPCPYGSPLLRRTKIHCPQKLWMGWG